MGRLRRTESPEGQCHCGLPPEGLAAKLESWKNDPDLCVIWAAFCPSSPLTLADGISLAKTRRSTNEVLQLLTGRGGTACGTCMCLRGAHQEADTSPRSPDEGAPIPAATLAQVPTDLWVQEAWADTVLMPWNSSGFKVVGRLAKSIHGEVHFVKDDTGTAYVAKVAPKDDVNLTKDGEESTWFSPESHVHFEDLRTEIAVLSFLSKLKCSENHIVEMFGSFEDVASLYLITAYCEEGDLFERVAYGDPLGEAEKKRYVGDILRGVAHLHRHNIGHRDLSLENVLLQKGNCVLIDFRQAVMLKSSDGVVKRYFVEAGKRMYRSPEMYVPRCSKIQVVCPSDAVANTVSMVSHEKMRCEVFLPSDAVPGKACTATPFGYAAAPADVFACGICAFVLSVGKPPWSVAMDTDPSFSFSRRHGVASLLQQWRGASRGPASSPSDEELLLTQMLRENPTRRSTPEECLRSSWLETRNRARTV
ncbi:unnamed protein product [Durusdinium trenchii]|uniref:Serine/threonine-protein kinase Chk1 (CHK1 checkpoint homolog) (Checkpoint kinase-1) n=2 Tax=Durusdinium trenchii TaxID=1381693 RepID=A0ABP0NJN4_9DINO